MRSGSEFVALKIKVSSMEREESLPDLPWQDADEAWSLLASGQVIASEVLALAQQAERVEYPHDGGKIVLHHWTPTATNSQPPVVLFHGGSGSWTHWVKNIEALTQAGLDVWAVDLPGFGESDGVPGTSDADGMLSTLAQLLEQQFPMQPVQLVGFSFGGMTAGLLAAAYPHLIAQLVIVGAPGFGLSAKHPFRLKGWRHLASPYAQLQRHVFNLGELMLHKPEHITKDTLALHVGNVQRDQLPRRRISSTDVLVQALTRVQCPVTAIYGEHDALYPELLDTVQKMLEDATPHFRGMHRVPEAGHWVQYECPSAFHAALLPILATH